MGVHGLRTSHWLYFLKSLKAFYQLYDAIDTKSKQKDNYQKNQYTEIQVLRVSTLQQLLNTQQITFCFQTVYMKIFAQT